jgi:D-aminoacyl-tRNA deacylase
VVVRALVQRVTTASVTVVEPDGEHEVGRIGAGLVAFVGVTHDDAPGEATKLADKLAGLRILPDDDGVMNRSAQDEGAEILVVSQFTLYADTSRGRRPSYVAAARPEVAEPLIEVVVERLRGAGLVVATGRFQAHMRVSLVNDGPVTIALEV